jgi:hypothetical protein
MIPVSLRTETQNRLKNQAGSVDRFYITGKCALAGTLHLVGDFFA